MTHRSVQQENKMTSYAWIAILLLGFLIYLGLGILFLRAVKMPVDEDLSVGCMLLIWPFFLMLLGFILLEDFLKRLIRT